MYSQTTTGKMATGAVLLQHRRGPWIETIEERRLLS